MVGGIFTTEITFNTENINRKRTQKKSAGADQHGLNREFHGYDLFLSVPIRVIRGKSE